MGRWSKRIKRYERHLLLGLVILLLVSFSITGAIQCQGQGGERATDWGGDFLITPTRKESLSNDDFVGRWMRYMRYLSAVGISSLRYVPESFEIAPPPQASGAWVHVMPVEAARAAGYRCGEEYQLKTLVRKAVQASMRGLEFNDASYDKFLRDNQLSAADFQDTLREIAVKDDFLRPLVETPRYLLPYPAAYPVWKVILQRVNLRYLALTAKDFHLPALRQEKTRERIGRQARLLQQVSATARTLDGLRTLLERWKTGHEGRFPDRLEDLGAEVVLVRRVEGRPRLRGEGRAGGPVQPRPRRGRGHVRRRDRGRGGRPEDPGPPSARWGTPSSPGRRRRRRGRRASRRSPRLPRKGSPPRSPPCRPTRGAAPSPGSPGPRAPPRPSPLPAPTARPGRRTTWPP